MKFVSSNNSFAVQETIKKAIDNYRDTADLSVALDILTKLKGIGPATASLLLSAHYPQKVLFFSDEAYFWLCNKGQKASLKYNMKEYESLSAEARNLMKRLDISAMEVEKVAYVLLKQEGSVSAPALNGSASKPAETEPTKPSQPTPAKRKKGPEEALEDKVPVRRSKRGKAV
ncbi:hypothetical protein CSPAE12_08144 [Colletotrichum incanum]|nr:hypothetical protein CSPAE12_08144 [Colletotrichum incanum]